MEVLSSYVVYTYVNDINELKIILDDQYHNAETAAEQNSSQYNKQHNS